jgi:uncharacterized protein YuzE
VAAPAPAEYLKLAPLLRDAPGGEVWSSYDREADVLYVTFKQQSFATDSELTDDDVIVRYDGDEVVGITILRASQR